MNANIQKYREVIKVGARQSHKNMTIYCLLAAEESTVDFVTLDEALDKGFLSITELDDTGSVPELRVTNKSDRKVLMLDGEKLVGAKQNRVLNVTVLIAAQSETIIPVSCVEQGRWSYRTREFGSAHRAKSADLKKALVSSTPLMRTPISMHTACLKIPNMRFGKPLSCLATRRCATSGRRSKKRRRGGIWRSSSHGNA